MTSEEFVSHGHVAYVYHVLASNRLSRASSMYTDNHWDFSLEEDRTGASSTLGDPSMIWNVHGVNYVNLRHGLEMMPGTYPPPSTCQPDQFDQAATESFSTFYRDNCEIMHNQRSTFQHSYVTTQSIRSYSPLWSLSHFSKDANLSDLQDWFALNEDTSYSDINYSIGAENLLVHYSMRTTYLAQNGSYSSIDFTLGSDMSSALCLSVSIPVTEAMDPTDTLIKPW
ncbi:hypothetical protein IW261DRAFT_1426841 [Armillaria novae-zelandiae]|uniref:Uncharacterized protein n=1 Tax=Armillaria novae-zelandiae TaxID=153914 RepID=A0AA39T5W0_9AGAR|nr:hypothetical protein IW261DRAFT_1426841 [Armillaria novae-zelandiae]